MQRKDRASVAQPPDGSSINAAPEVISHDPWELVNAVDIGLSRAATDGTVQTWNPAAERITGWPASAIIGQSISKLAAPGQESDARAFFKEVLTTGKPVQFQGRRIRPDGTEYWLDISIAPIRGSDGTITGVAGSMRDISQKREREVRLRELARTDSLTGLDNGGELDQRLMRALEMQATEGKQGALLKIDVDDFREINDRHGHQIGDEALRQIARRIVHSTKGSDARGRLGGDEFSVVCESLEDAEEASVVAQRILFDISRPLHVHGETIRLQASCGIVVFPDDGTDLPTLMNRSDQALNAARAHGGGHAQRYREDLIGEEGQVDQIAQALRDAVNSDRFFMRWQPIADIRSGRVSCVEALARWDHPTLGELPPAAFLPPAEEIGLIIPLGVKLIDLAVESAASWHRSLTQSPPPKIAVNISRAQFAADDLVALIASTCQRHQFNPNYLVLEITESAIFEDPESASATLERLKGLGVEISLDDFGTGYNSLASLQELSLDSMKIDRSFVTPLICADPRFCASQEKALVEAIAHLGHNLGLRVIAEGVENPTQIECLKLAGCDEVQGFFLSRPLPEDQVVTHLAEIQSRLALMLFH